MFVRHARLVLSTEAFVVIRSRPACTGYRITSFPASVLCSQCSHLLGRATTIIVSVVVIVCLKTLQEI